VSPSQVQAALSQLPGWTAVDDALTCEWRFATFVQAMAFMADAALEIDRLDHHPEWTNVYDRVRVRCCTHDAGNSITSKDVELAKTLSWVAARFI